MHRTRHMSNGHGKTQQLFPEIYIFGRFTQTLFFSLFNLSSDKDYQTDNRYVFQKSTVLDVTGEIKHPVRKKQRAYTAEGVNDKEYAR